MKNYRLTKDAEQDLREVARYTRKEWGLAMLREYRGGLKKTFEAIGKNDVVSRDFSDNFPELLVTKLQAPLYFLGNYIRSGRHG